MSAVKSREAEATVDPLFINRRSPRAYTGEEISDSALFSVFEAARWAPSARNGQPCRFVYAKRGSAVFDQLIAAMAPYNQKWASQASALIALLSATTYLVDGKPQPNTFHSFDAGAAWISLSLQANLLGLHTRAIGNFDRAQATAVLKAPASYALEIMIAIGKSGDPELLPPDLRKLEVTTTRAPLRDLVSKEAFRS